MTTEARPGEPRTMARLCRYNRILLLKMFLVLLAVTGVYFYTYHVLDWGATVRSSGSSANGFKVGEFASNPDLQEALRLMREEQEEEEQEQADDDVCPSFTLTSGRKPDPSGHGDVTCRRITPIKGSCKLGREMFEGKDVETCESWGEARDICKLQEIQGPDKYRVRCDPNMCKSSMALGTIHPNLGILDWQEFSTVDRLQLAIRRLATADYSQYHYGFCYIRCRPFHRYRRRKLLQDTHIQHQHLHNILNCSYSDDMYRKTRRTLFSKQGDGTAFLVSPRTLKNSSVHSVVGQKRRISIPEQNHNRRLLQDDSVNNNVDTDKGENPITEQEEEPGAEDGNFGNDFYEGGDDDDNYEDERYNDEDDKEEYDYYDDEQRYIMQLIILPPQMKPTEKPVNGSNKINVNIILLDSLSRHHFYRSLPQTLSQFHSLNSEKRSTAKVLDFELVQAIRSRTFESVQALFAGEIFEPDKGFSSQDMPPKPLEVEKMFMPFKRQGYETLWLEDLCWTWEWGLVKNLAMIQFGERYRLRWRSFREAVKKAGIDRLDSTLTSCDILKESHLPDMFHGPPAICFNGRYQHEYLLSYLRQMQAKMTQLNRPLLSYLMLNTAHEDSGLRVQTLDQAFSEYVRFVAGQQNTLTIIFADHGNSYGDFLKETYEGQIELYHPALFMIVPDKVAKILGHKKMKALTLNQHRLVSLLDAHYTIKSLLPKKEQSMNPAHRSFYMLNQNGLLSDIPPNRTCSQVPRILPNLCICEGYDSPMRNDSYHTLFAEFALGTLNNHILQQFGEANPQAVSGVGSCQRLVAHGFKNVKERHGKEGVVVVTLDLHVQSGDNSGQPEDIFTVVVQFDENEDTAMTLLGYERVSKYGHYSKCADKGVNVKLCVCSLKKPLKPPNVNKVPRWNLHYPMVLGRKTKVSELDKGCLFALYRQNESGVSFELANVCPSFSYTVWFDLEVSNMHRSVRTSPKKDLKPGDIQFTVVLLQTRTHHSWRWTYKTRYMRRDYP
ncbi:uncharacterized protein [Branchiostoma lanceolatum]|uniref:uncharacterized protein n=1 Tax=Branchiostoma lanceolatum TaxID=7740 RepID=UPI00345641B2